MNSRGIGFLLLACLLAIPSTLFAGQALPSDPLPAVERPRFGPYAARIINREIVRDVRVDAELNMWLQLEIPYKDREIRVKISNEPGRSYRKWWHDQYELVSPANAGKEPLGWTDRIQVQAPYIEYWMDGQLFLHLERVDR